MQQQFNKALKAVERTKSFGFGNGRLTSEYVDHSSLPVVHGPPRSDEPMLIRANHPRTELPGTDIAHDFV